MRKLAFLFVAVVAVSFASCGNKAAGEAPVVDSDSVSVSEPIVDDTTATDTATTDSVKADSTAAAPAPAAE